MLFLLIRTNLRLQDLQIFTYTETTVIRQSINLLRVIYFFISNYSHHLQQETIFSFSIVINSSFNIQHRPATSLATLAYD